MTISIGITKIVVLADYPEDGTGLLNEANIKLVKLNSELLKPWTSLIIHDSETSAKVLKN
jgi:dCMP deaminase